MKQNLIDKLLTFSCTDDDDDALSTEMEEKYFFNLRRTICIKMGGTPDSLMHKDQVICEDP